MIYTIPVSALRFEMKTAIEAVGEPDSYVLVTKHGKRVAAFVSLNMLDRMINYEDMERYGRYDPASGLREKGALWRADVHGNPATKWEQAPNEGKAWYGDGGGDKEHKVDASIRERLRQKLSNYVVRCCHRI